jgi:hypothetical protein
MLGRRAPCANEVMRLSMIRLLLKATRLGAPRSTNQTCMHAHARDGKVRKDIAADRPGCWKTGGLPEYVIIARGVAVHLLLGSARSARRIASFNSLRFGHDSRKAQIGADLVRSYRRLCQQF